MFFCEITGTFSKPGEKLNKIVTKQRPRTYSQRVFNEETREMETLEVGRGWEIVKEINVSARGQKIWDAWTPEERALYADDSVVVAHR